MLFPPEATDRIGPDVDTLLAIAGVILERADSSLKYELFSCADPHRTPAELAHDAIIWSKETAAAMSEDRERFAVAAGTDSLLEKAWRNPLDSVNQIGDVSAFKLGFDVAMKLAARIVAAPLEHHDPGEILADAQRNYLELLKEQRREYFQFEWPHRLARAKAESQSAGSRA